MRRALVVLLAFGLVAAACGGGGDDPAAIADAIADGMMEGGGPDAPFSRSEAECFGKNSSRQLFNATTTVLPSCSSTAVHSGSMPNTDGTTAHTMLMKAIARFCSTFPLTAFATCSVNATLPMSVAAGP